MALFGIEGLEVVQVKQVGDLVKDIDKADLDSNYFLDKIGVRTSGENYIAQRDYGTKNRFHCPPLRPNATVALSSMGTQSGLTQITTATAHGYSNGDVIYIDESVSRLNGKWTVSNVATYTFTLVGTTGESGASIVGITTKTPIAILKVHTFYDKTTGTETEIVVGLDSNNKMRIYYYTPLDALYSWTELTRYYDGIYDQVASASGTNIRIKTITENGVAASPANDAWNNWVLINTSTGQAVFVTDTTYVSAQSIDADIDLSVAASGGLNWTDGATVKAVRFPAIHFNYEFDNGATPHIDFIEVEQRRRVTMLYSNGTTARQPLEIMKCDARNYFWDGSQYLRTLPAGWYIESDYGVPNPFSASDGSAESPISASSELSWAISGATNATPIVISSGHADVLTNGDQVIIMGVLGNTAANGIWTVANKTPTTFELYGSVGNGAYTGGGVSVKARNVPIYDKASCRHWLNVAVGAYQLGGLANPSIRAYVTAQYGPIESDVIFSGYYEVANVAIIPVFDICFALMNKELTGLNIYLATTNQTVYDAGWPESSSDYYSVPAPDTSDEFYFAVQSVSTASQTLQQITRYFLRSVLATIDFTVQAVELLAGQGNLSIYAALNHEVDKNRSYPTPTFATKGTRDQGSIIATNDGDTALRLSLYDGYGVHQDSNTPDVALDRNGNKLRVELLGTSEILGLEVLYDTIFVFRRRLIETYDLQGVAKRTYEADVVAKNSIVATPYGIVYAGSSAIFLVPADGSDIRVLNDLWDSWYNGDVKVVSDTPYVTDAYRSAIIGGYNEKYREVYQIITVNTETSYETILFRYSFDQLKWSQRRLNSTDTIVNLSRRQVDGSLSICMTKGVLMYPNRTGSYRWEDDVLIDTSADERSQSKPVPMTFTINVARFNSQIVENVLHGFVMRHTGASTGEKGMLKFEFYANEQTEPFDTQYVLVDERMEYRAVESIGTVERLRVKVTMPEDTIFQNLDIIQLTFGVLPNR